MIVDVEKAKELAKDMISKYQGVGIKDFGTEINFRFSYKDNEQLLAVVLCIEHFDHNEKIELIDILVGS